MRKLAECIHGMIVKSGLNENVTIATGLLDLYAKLGRLTYSLKIFGEVNNPDKGAWTAMLAAYAVHGYGREAMELFESMLKEGGEPDHVTFTHLQSDCSHSGLVEVGKNDFNIMPQVYGIEPRAYGNAKLGKEVAEILFSLDPSDSRNYIHAIQYVLCSWFVEGCLKGEGFDEGQRSH
ncbi:hypothetical protein ACFX15_033271 [Malus domestica]